MKSEDLDYSTQHGHHIYNTFMVTFYLKVSVSIYLNCMENVFFYGFMEERM